MENVFNQSLWGDEGFSAILSMRPLPEIIKIIANDTSPPLWNVTEWIVFNTLGTSEVYIRGLSFLYFLGAVFFTYKIGSLLWDKKTGIIAGVLSFLNPFFFIYAFEGRMYSILALGVIASMYFFLKKNWIGYIISSVWALYSHHFAIFALLIQGFWFVKEFILGKRDIAKLMFKSFLAIGIFYIPWIIPLYNQTRMVGGGFWLGTPTPKNLVGLFTEYMARGIEHPLSIFALYSVIAILLVRKWGRGVNKTSFLLIWFFGPIVLTWIISQVFQSIFFNRYLLYTIPALTLILASNHRKNISRFLVAVSIVFFAIIDTNYFTHPKKLPFRQLANYVKKTQKEGDFLINWNSAAHHLWETKYYGFPAPIYVPKDTELPFFVGTALMKEGDIVSVLPEHAQRIGIVSSGPVEEISLSGYTEKERVVMDRLKFIWFEKL